MSQEIIRTYINLAGSALTGIGSILLAWRIKEIVKWVSLSLAAHEISIHSLSEELNGRAAEFPVVEGAVKHLADVENRLGTRLVIAGFASLGFGMILNCVSIVITL